MSHLQNLLYTVCVLLLLATVASRAQATEECIANKVCPRTQLNLLVCLECPVICTLPRVIIYLAPSVLKIMCVNIPFMYFVKTIVKDTYLASLGHG